MVLRVKVMAALCVSPPTNSPNPKHIHLLSLRPRKAVNPKIYLAFLLETIDLLVKLKC